MKYYLSFSLLILLSCTRTETRNNRPVENIPSDVLTIEKIQESIHAQKKEYENCTIKTLRADKKKLPSNASLVLRAVISGDGKVQILTKEAGNFNNINVQNAMWIR